MTPKEKAEMELIRRFKVRIMNVKIQNLQPDILNAYLQFTIGGDFSDDFIITPSGKKVISLEGQRGPSIKTELMRGAEKDEIRHYKLNFDCEYRGSYIMLREQKLEIEVHFKIKHEI